MIDQREDELVRGAIYRIRSRNLGFGVWNGEGFIGIREKFGTEFLDIEYLNTARAIEMIDVHLDERILLRTHYDPSYCWWCGWPVEWLKELRAWRHLEDRGCPEVRAFGKTYTPLFEAMKRLEGEFDG